MSVASTASEIATPRAKACMRLCTRARRRLGRPRPAPGRPAAHSEQHDDPHQCQQRAPRDARLARGEPRGTPPAADPVTTRGCRRPERPTARGRAVRRTPSAPRATTPDETPTTRRRSVRPRRESCRAWRPPTAGAGPPARTTSPPRANTAPGRRSVYMPTIGLQQRGGQLHGERDEPDLREGQIEGRFQDRVDRRNQRLDRVVQQVRHADRRRMPTTVCPRRLAHADRAFHALGRIPPAANCTKSAAERHRAHNETAQIRDNRSMSSNLVKRERIERRFSDFAGTT